jgi:hypothetical protein
MERVSAVVPIGQYEMTVKLLEGQRLELVGIFAFDPGKDLFQAFGG